jgi:hypothetical protein
MKSVAALIVLLALAIPTKAHRLDEYLQATRIALAMDRIDLTIDLTPGVAILKKLLPAIDADGNGRISSREGDRYAQRVVDDLRLVLDGKPQSIRIVRATFPSRAAMEEGEGIIHLKAVAKIQPLTPGHHGILFRNEHLPGISVYLVNALVPKSKTIQITAQNRDEYQKEYHLRFEVE